MQKIITQNFYKSLLFVVIGFFFFGVAQVYAGTLDPFSYSASSYIAGATADYTFTFTTETADPNMIFRALWSNNSGISLNTDTPTVTINGEEKIPSEYWYGGGTYHNPYIRMGIPIAGGSEVVIVIPNVTNGSAGTYSWANDIFTADSGANAIDRPASIASLTLVNDTTDPTVSTLSPADDATDVAVDANLVITFDEIVDAETGNITLKTTSGDTTVETFDVTSDISGSGSTTITINPTDNLESETEYYVLIDATAFDDTSGNSYAGISDTTVWSFTTADVNNPTVSTLSPVDDATDVAIDANLVITFDEIVDAETGNITLKTTSGDTTVETFDVTSDISGSGSTTITVNPAADLANETGYYIQIDATAFDDTAGNSYAGIGDTTTWSFTTVAAPQVDTGSISGGYANRVRSRRANTQTTTQTQQNDTQGQTVQAAASDTFLLRGILTRRGDQGPHVRQLQILLNQFNDANLDTDGMFGPLTEQAVKNFQRKHNLVFIDGIVGPETLSKF